ncbi:MULTISPECIES: hypothetical protein [Enterococcus]|uniref:hypothetical protein n=1 Tax=Enterococcus TaxID=1350 RepID=UPI00064C6A72|nr:MULTISPECIES: hypothetical protein [Enterococcus]NTL77414.1 hypothetical protein [Enterococcus faecium]WJW77538.1 hypothetical protein QWG62_10480 [Enterococcus faecium]WVI87455.1 hypothetical protein VOF41_10045 [Enterococcus lactis]
MKKVISFMQYRKKIGKISLIHIVYPVFNQNSRRMSTVPIARGIIAIGPISIGIVSFGIMGLGFFTFGLSSSGILSAGIVPLGIIAVGTIPIGYLALGNIAIGFQSFGNIVFGKWALGNIAYGENTISLGKHPQFSQVKEGILEMDGIVNNKINMFRAIDGIIESYEWFWVIITISFLVACLMCIGNIFSLKTRVGGRK